MKEPKFLKLRSPRWKQLEEGMKSKNSFGPDELADLYVELSDDLSYSRTFYPNSKTTAYLNQLALSIHRKIYKNKKEDKGSFIYFWKTGFPLAFFEARKAMLLSFSVFLISFLIGALSTSIDPDFTRLIMGDQYVDQTLINIDKDDPMAVYSSMQETQMFSYITLNNIMVSFMIFASGILTSWVTGILLARNGLMLGAFLTFFMSKDLTLLSNQAIWIHGTLEIFAIIVAGGAGILMGNGWLFPGTYSRKIALQQAAKKGGILLMGLVPVFIIAGFLESFVTRYYKNAPMSFTIIGLSLLFIISYFIVYPYFVSKRSYGKPKD